MLFNIPKNVIIVFNLLNGMSIDSPFNAKDV